jgi:alpha-tubulin suppressor-like RCC1 family protein
MCVLASGAARCFGSNLLGASTGQYSYDRGIEASDMGRNLPEVDLGVSCAVRAVATGAYHACALLEDGRVKCWGNNRSGELGLGDTNNRTAGAQELGNRLPAVDLGRHHATAITAGLSFSCALLDSGAVKCWGDNTYGQLGVGDAANHGDDPGEMGDALPAVDLGRGRTAKAISAGHAHACAILDDDTLKCWGLNASGQLGQGDARGRGAAAADLGDALLPVDLGRGHHAKSVALGPKQTCAVLENNALKCWGFNDYGNLGLGDTNARGDGPGEMGDNLPAVDVGARCGGVRSVVMGGGFTCAVLGNSTLKCWGNNDSGTLGLGDLERRGDGPGEMGDALPTVNLGHGRSVRRAFATYLNACAELDNGKLKCWGSSMTGMLGIGPSNLRGDQASNMGDHLPSFDLGSCSIKAFASGFPYHFGCALLSSGGVKCWGANSYGQLGIDRSSHAGDEPGDMGTALADLSLGAGRSVASIAPGNYHSCALLDNGDVKCWGANFAGALGQGDTKRRDGRPSAMGDHLPKVDLGTGRTATVLAVGADHSCAILDDGTLKCWGDNSNGELGLGDTNARGDAPDEMGDHLPVVDLGAGRHAKALSLGNRHSCALLDDDTLRCWGYNYYEQLGIGSIGDRGDNPGEMGDNLPPVLVGSKKPIAVAAGFVNTCAQFEDGSLKCWGNNDHGQLGQGHNTWIGSNPAQMGDALPAIDLGAGRQVLKVGVGVERVCALLDNQTVKCWGYGGYGALGYGDSADRGAAPGQMGDALLALDFGASEAVLGLATSQYDSCVLLSSGTKCWGWNQMGQLGLGDTLDRGAQLVQLGDNLPLVDLR